ncbi:COG2972 Predicted signal transduction protein with a C-terminal ATPase domain [Spirosomataceae bacterium]
MNIKNIILKRLLIILSTSLGIGLLILLPVILTTDTTFFRYLLAFLKFFSHGLVSWTLNITFSIFFIQSLKSPLWKWLVSTICLIIYVSSLYLISKDFFIIKTPNFHYVRLLNVTSINTFIFATNMWLNTFDTKLKLEDENNKLKINRLQAELAHLKNQINPHFLFNALSSLKSLMVINHQNAENYLIKLSEFLIASIGQTNDLVSLQDELSICNNYVDLQKIRFQDSLIYETEIDPNALQNCIPFFALQSLIENALKHNIVSLLNPLTIRVEVKGDQLTIINNTQAFLSEEASSKIGLQNLNERMKILTGQPIVIDKNQHYFKVQLPLLSNPRAMDYSQY